MPNRLRPHTRAVGDEKLSASDAVLKPAARASGAA